MSQVVLDEIRLGEPEMAGKRLKLMEQVALLDLTDEVRILTREILESGLLPVGADRDAAHIALATTHKMDILLSWNCRHIANAFIQERLRRLTADFGYMLPVLCTPDELLNDLL